VNAGLLVLRLLLATLLAGHATQKLFGWFGGMGREKTATVFGEWGFRPGKTMVLTAGSCELAASASLSLGLLTQAGCAIAIGTMIVAASANIRNGLWAHLGGCEVAVTYAGLASVLALTGPGRFSLDRLIGFHPAIGWDVGAIVVGVVASVPPLLRRRAALRSEAVAS
jgi:putative oxidoreductase